MERYTLSVYSPGRDYAGLAARDYDAPRMAGTLDTFLADQPGDVRGEELLRFAPCELTLHDGHRLRVSIDS